MYDSSDKKSIYEYSKKAIGQSFYDLIEQSTYTIAEEKDQYLYANKKRKGGLGELVEEYFFGYKSNSDTGPDFLDAGLELKVTPYKKNKNGTYSSKERLVLNMIDYKETSENNFFESRLWEKNKNLLIIFYLWSKEINNRLDYRITHSILYSPIGEDLEIIIQDYNTIRKKILEGKAHELSEGDTMYLGAVTKSSSSKNRTSQPYSNELAKPRAFSLKNSYMTYLLREYVLIDKPYLEEVQKVYLGSKKDHLNFEDFILDKFNPYINMTERKILKKFGINYLDIKSNKSRFAKITDCILGIETYKIEEFIKADIEVKSIRISYNERIVESMSFPSFNIMDVIKESWEESYIKNFFSNKKFLFVVYKENKDGEFTLNKVKFWNMPSYIIDKHLREDWNKILNVFKSGVEFDITYNYSGKEIIKNNLPKKKDLYMLEVRPHASKSAYLIDGVKYGGGKLSSNSDLLPNGDRMTKQCFWLQNKFLEKILLD